MSADIKVFYDEECTREFSTLPTGEYEILFSDPLGADGTHGDAAYTTLYIRNVGTRAALHTQVIIYVNTSIKLELLSNNLIGDLKVGEMRKLVFKTTISKGEKFKVVYPFIYIDYYTLPDIAYKDTYNPYTSIRLLWGLQDCECPMYVPIDTDVLRLIDAVYKPIENIEDYLDKDVDLSSDNLLAIIEELDSCNCSSEDCSVMPLTPMAEEELRLLEEIYGSNT